MDPTTPVAVTLQQLIVANVVASLPILLIAVRGVWYLSQMSSRFERMWKWWDGEHGDASMFDRQSPPPTYDGQERRTRRRPRES